MALLNFWMTLKKKKVKGTVKKFHLSVRFFFFLFPFFVKTYGIRQVYTGVDKEPQGQPLHQSDKKTTTKKGFPAGLSQTFFSTVKQKKEKGERGSGRGEERGKAEERKRQRMRRLNSRVSCCY